MNRILRGKALLAMFLLGAGSAVSLQAHADLPICGDALTTDQLNAAMQPLVEHASEDQRENWGNLIIAATHSLGCRLQDEPDSILADGFEVAPAPAASEAAQPSTTCQQAYCPDVSYCGEGDSTSNPLTFAGTPTLNQGCFQHDSCYAAECGPAGCYFNPNNAPNSQCDAALFSVCADATVLQTATNRAVCSTAAALQSWFGSFPKAACADSGAAHNLTGVFSGTFAWVCGVGYSGQHSITLDIQQAAGSGGDFTGTIVDNGVSMPLSGQRGCRLTDRFPSSVDRLNPRGRALWLSYPGTPNVPGNIWWGSLNGDRLDDPVSGLSGATENGETPTPGYPGCSAYVGPSGSFWANLP